MTKPAGILIKNVKVLVDLTLTKYWLPIMFTSYHILNIHERRVFYKTNK